MVLENLVGILRDTNLFGRQLIVQRLSEVRKIDFSCSFFTSFFTFIGFSSWTLRLVDEQASDNNEGAKAHANGAEPGNRSR